MIDGREPLTAGPVRTRAAATGTPAAELFLGHSKLLRDAHELAARAHAGQRQESDGSAYIEHPLAVAAILRRAGFGDEVVAAGLLHDTVEASEIELDELERRFGRPVARLVAAMTEPERHGRFGPRKAAHRLQIAQAGAEAAAIFAADKVANVRSLRRALRRDGEEAVRRRLSAPLEQKIEHYRATLEMLDGLALPLSLAPMLATELQALTSEGSRGPVIGSAARAAVRRTSRSRPYRG